MRGSSGRRSALAGLLIADLTQKRRRPHLHPDPGRHGGGGDDARAWVPPYCGDESPTCMAVNRSKRSLAVDMTLCLGLLQPVRHAHLAVHRRRGGEVLARLLGLARLRVQRAEAELAVGDERTHAVRLGESQRLVVVGLATLGVEPIGMSRDVAE